MKSKRSNWNWVSLVIGTSLITGCGKSFQAQEFQQIESLCGIDCQPAPRPPEKKVDLDAEADLGPLGTHKVIEIDQILNIVKFRIPLPSNPIGVGIEEEIRQMPGATWAIEMDTKGDWGLVVKVPIEYVVKGVKFAPSKRLPNGDPLPGVPGGELPSIGLELDQTDFFGNLYFGIETFAIFVPTPGFDPLLKLTFPIKNKSNRKTIGYISAVPEKAAFDGGFFLSLRVPDELARLIDGI